MSRASRGSPNGRQPLSAGLMAVLWRRFKAHRERMIAEREAFARDGRRR